MKKLLMFLVLLTVSVGSWAQTVSEFWVWIDENTQGTQISGFSSTPGSVSTYLSSAPTQVNEASILRINGATLNADDLNALLSLPNLKYLDLGGSTFTDNDLLSDMTFSVNSTSVHTVVLPGGLSKAQVNAAGAKFADLNGNFGSCLSQESETTPVYTTHYWYTPEGGTDPVEIDEGDVITDGEGNMTYTYVVQYDEQKPLTFDNNSSRFWYTYNNKEYPITEEEYSNHVTQDQWGNVSVSNITIEEAQVDVTKTTYYYQTDGVTQLDVNQVSQVGDKYYYGGSLNYYTWLSGTPAVYNEEDGFYYRTQADGGTKLENHEIETHDNVVYYNNQYGQKYEGGHEAVVKDAYVYRDPSDNNVHTLATVDVGDPIPSSVSEGEGGSLYATVTLTNQQSVQPQGEYVYTYYEHDGTTQNTKTFNVAQADGATTTVYWEEAFTEGVSTTETSADVTTSSVVAYVNTAGSLYRATYLAPVNPETAEKIVISGNLTLDDLAPNSNGADPLNNRGLEYIAAIDEAWTNTTTHPAWYISNKNTHIKDLDLSGATIDNPKYLRVLSNENSGPYLERIVFPDELRRIPSAACYANGTSGC